MISRLERAVREVSDLRSFYLRLQKLRRESSESSDPLVVEETSAPYTIGITFQKSKVRD
jgi:hypothetical protein